MLVTKFLDVNERIYMIMSFVPREDLKVVESGFSGVGGREATTGNTSAVRRLLMAWPFSFRTLIFTARKIGFTQIYSMQKSVFLLANTMT